MAETPERTSSRSTIIIYIVVGVIVLIAAGVSWYFYNQYQQAQALLKNPSGVLAQKDKDTIEKVGKLMDLPSEQPTIAEVSDKSKLASQPFFAHAENGDKVLIFTNAKKAVLYRPSTNKIIEVGPVNIPPASAEVPAASNSAQTAPSQVNIALYNGTTTVGLTSVAEKKFSDKNEPVTVVLKDNAVKKPYDKSIVVDLSGKHKDLATALANIIGGTVGSLPDGESKPDPANSEGKTADILVILGADFVK